MTSNLAKAKLSVLRDALDDLVMPFAKNKPDLILTTENCESGWFVKKYSFVSNGNEINDVFVRSKDFQKKIGLAVNYIECRLHVLYDGRVPIAEGNISRRNDSIYYLFKLNKLNSSTAFFFLKELNLHYLVDILRLDKSIAINCDLDARLQQLYNSWTAAVSNQKKIAGSGLVKATMGDSVALNFFDGYKKNYSIMFTPQMKDALEQNFFSAFNFVISTHGIVDVTETYDWLAVSKLA